MCTIRIGNCEECPWYQEACGSWCLHPKHPRNVAGDTELIIDVATIIDPDCPLPEEETK